MALFKTGQSQISHALYVSWHNSALQNVTHQLPWCKSKMSLPKGVQEKLYRIHQGVSGKSLDNIQNMYCLCVYEIVLSLQAPFSVFQQLSLLLPPWS